ncbi:hypothetical protein E2C01_029348 [Portunus trituberculatus]|uniref:Uncharacterized protein n=1 Tax=Portunus trituberculatus TaxID=210409 RepID=A0A5B7ERL1_PORTR|nr:hypothetical protein [Portunus trituberculatus]
MSLETRHGTEWINVSKARIIGLISVVYNIHRVSSCKYQQIPGLKYVSFYFYLFLFLFIYFLQGVARVGLPGF